jgi:hypothetical protein
MKHLFIVLVLAVAGFGIANAQSTSDINIFGYFQADFQYSAPAKEKVSNTFNLQQLNLFFDKNFSNNLSAFVNTEITNTFSTEHGWGNFNLEEAWLKYSPNGYFNVQAGLLVPEFNNLNEIKNKTPLLPYVFRPLVYEATISSLLDFAAYLPERAFIQVKGSAPYGDAWIDYAVHVGNSGTQYITNSTNGVYLPGQDTTSFKAVGGRVGVRWAGLKAGVSYTYDRDNQTTLMLGNLPRTRIGADMSLAIARFTIEGEYIAVNDAMKASDEATLSMIAMFNPMVRTSLKKSFYYGNVMYDVTDRLYGYAGYSYLDDKSNSILEKGVESLTAGAGFRASESVVVKGQWAHFKMKDQTYFQLDQNTYFVAVSVLF